jgi:dipeptidyl aminopeptidase/acylaminoacyl peptidase
MKRLYIISGVIISGIIALWAFPIELFSADKRPITFDDFIHIKRISDPQISPDGNRVAYVITEMDLERNRSRSDIWIIPLQGGEARRLTSEPGSHYHPRWSPDGRRLAFMSTRSGAPQIWLLNIRGGEARQVTHLAGGAGGVIWSPTGTHLAFTSSVFPDYRDEEDNARRIKAQQESPVKARLFTELLFRHWNAWREGQRSHLFVLPVEGDSRAVDVTSGDFDTPPISLGSSQDYAFSPDGSKIGFVRNIDPDLRKGNGTNNDLFIHSLADNKLAKITSSRANDNGVYFSPDGRWLAYRAMSRPGFEADRYQLILYDRLNGESQSLTEEADFSVNDILWSPDSKHLYITYQDQAWDVLARIDVSGKNLQPLLERHVFGSPALSPDGKTMLFTAQTIHAPAEIFAMTLADAKPVQLTHANDELLARLDMRPPEEFWFQGAEEERVHGLMVLPPGFDPASRYPLVMLIHGGPQGAWKDNFHYRWNASMFAAPGYVVVLINFHGSTGYGQDFTDSISGDWGGKPFLDLEKGLDFLLDRFDFIDEDRMAAAGASYGGYMINWIEGHPNRYRCLISHAGVFDLRSMYGATEELWFPEWEFRGTPWSNPEQYERWSPSTLVQNFKTPCLVIHGQRDFRVPVTQGFQLFTSLQRQEVASRLLYFPDEGHFVTKPRNAELWWRVVHEWLAAYLGKQ